jgi:thioesterase domain-containing protein
MHQDPETLCRETEEFLHVQIPITKAMGVRVETYDATHGHLVLTAPLEANHNHLGTAFGGSLSALCTLAGYALLWLELGDRHSHIVVRDSSIQYKKPVRAKTIRIQCARPEAAALTQFRERFAKQGKARISLESTVEEDGEKCVEFTGTFVAVK